MNVDGMLYKAMQKGIAAGLTGRILNDGWYRLDGAHGSLELRLLELADHKWVAYAADRDGRLHGADMITTEQFEENLQAAIDGVVDQFTRENREA